MGTEEKEPYGYIYLATNEFNGKVYVGQTTTSRWEGKVVPIEGRWKEETQEAYSGARQDRDLRRIERAVIKYGSENFSLEEIDIAYNQEELDAKETFWIRELDAMNPEKGYNMTEGGLGGRPSEEVREKLSMIGQEKWDQDVEYRKRQVAERRERAKDPEWIQKMTEINRERAKNPEWKEKMSQVSKTKWDTDKEYREKQVNERRERAKDPEWIKKMTEINRERAKDLEYRKKMSEIIKEIAKDPNWRNKITEINRERAKNLVWLEKMAVVNQEIARNPETQEKISESLTEKWKDPKFQENVSKGVTDKWQGEKHRVRQFTARREGKREIPDKMEFLKEIQTMKKKDIIDRYDMDGKCINRRIKEMLGHRGVNNFSEAKKYLEAKDLKKVFKDVMERLENLPEPLVRKKEISDKREFLQDIQNMKANEIARKYGMNETTVRKRICEMLGDQGVKNITELRKYLEGKNLDEVVKDVEERMSDQSHIREGTTIISDKQEFLRDIQTMQKNEIDIKYGMDAKTINNKIKEILREKRVNNYTEAREYLDDKDINGVLRDIEEGSDEEQGQLSESLDGAKKNESEQEDLNQEEDKIENSSTESSTKLERQVTKDYEGIDIPQQVHIDYRGIGEGSSPVKKDYGFIDDFGYRHKDNISNYRKRDFEGIDKPKERKKKDYEELGESFTEGAN